MCVDWVDVRISGTDIKPDFKEKLISEVGITSNNWNVNQLSEKQVFR